MTGPSGSEIQDFKVRGNYPRLRVLLTSIKRREGRLDKIPPRLPGYSPPIVEVEVRGPRGVAAHSIAVRDVDLPLLCQPDLEAAKMHLSRILRARRGDRAAADALTSALGSHFRSLCAGSGNTRAVDTTYVVPSTSRDDHSELRISHKGSILLRLSLMGYPVPDFVILTSDAYADWTSRLEQRLVDAIGQLEALTGKRLGGGENPLVFAIRCAMPYYAPGVMPTYLNVGVTEGTLAALGRTIGPEAANKMLLNNLRNLCVALDRQASAPIVASIRPTLSPEETASLVRKVSEIVRRKDRRLVEDAFWQTEFLIKQAYQYFEANRDLLITLSRGASHYPAVIMQEMICTVRHDEAYAGVLFSRNPQTGMGRQLETAHNIFGEEIMTGTMQAEQTTFEDRETIKDTYSAVHHFAEQLPEVEREFESPVTIEFAVDATRRYQLFALLQLNETGMSGRAAFISAVDLHKSGAITRKRVTQLIRPYHVKQIASDTIDAATFDILNRFCSGIAILPRSAVSARIFFSTEDALKAKKRGEKVCLCKKAFVPSDTVVMREMDAIVSLTSAAIHVVTICQSFGAPALLSLDMDGVSLQPDGRLLNASGKAIRNGEWITISSRQQALYQGRAQFKPARLLRYLKGEPVNIEDDEEEAFDAMAYAYRYHQQLVRGLKIDQISTLGEVIRLVNLELRGEAEEARRLVNGWFDGHEPLYVQEVLNSEMGDHLNQSTVYEMLTLDRKIRFFKRALARCSRERISGYSAGAFMLGRFICVFAGVAFWKGFDPLEIGLLVNEWILFEKYMQVLHEVGERKILRARKKIQSEGLDEILLNTGKLKGLLPLKLCGIDLDEVRRALPEWSDHQAAKVVELLRMPYGAFFDYDAPWSVGELERLCLNEQLPVPRPDDI